MPQFWKRKIRLQIAGLIITEPHISLDIRRESNPTRPSGTVTIYNLSRDHEQAIYERGRTIKVEAGYGVALGLLFDGAVGQVEREREDLTRKTKISLAAVSAGNDRLNGITNRSYDGPVKLRQVVRDLASDLKMEAGPLNAIPSDLEVRFYWAGGKTTDALSSYLGRHGLTWYDDDGLIRVTRPGQAQPDAADMTLSPENGLIGAPTVTDSGTGKDKRDGARARSLLNPVFALGGRVTLESETLTGTYKVVTLRHHGDNWTSRNFYTELDMKKL